LVRDDLIKTSKDKEISLTKRGQAIAEHLQRRHRVVERWLTDVLGLDWAKSDAEAHHLEHAMSDEVAELLNKHLGYPATCPHGNPIPGNISERDLDAPSLIQLSTAEEGARVLVSRISEYAENVAELLDYLGARGIIPGARVKVDEVAPLEGPLTLRVDHRVVSMSREVANYVWVKQANG
jgi:DtxR family Mn-dependent transcriptional regulator